MGRNKGEVEMKKMKMDSLNLIDNLIEDFKKIKRDFKFLKKAYDNIYEDVIDLLYEYITGVDTEDDDKLWTNEQVKDLITAAIINFREYKQSIDEDLCKHQNKD